MGRIGTDMRYIYLTITTSVLALLAGTASAQSSPSDVFTLGEINVTARDESGSAIGSSVLTSEEMWTHNRTALDDALNLLPGVSTSNTGGSRNERTISVRGFDRFQVPLSIDGIRVYLPADNRLDFNRFLTPDVSEVQVAKGYVSVLDGPGGMGGAINLVTRKPTKAVEGEARGGLTFDGNGALSGNTTYARAGSRLEKFYVQASGARTERTHIRLSDDFNRTVNENGGNRDHSDTKDWRINLKAGFTPNDTDEYSVSFTKQDGEKETPPHITDTLSSQRYWTWPYWDIMSLYWLSNTRIGDASYIKTKLYYNTFQNGLYSWDDANYSRQVTSKAFSSYYDDKAAGGSVEVGTDLIANNTLKGVIHYRRDIHKESQDSFSPRFFSEPTQTTEEDTWSVAVENTWHATKDTDVVVGVGYDWRILDKAEDWTGTSLATGTFINYPTANSHALNWQGAVIHRYSDTGRVHASLSSRTRFPTIFERFSSRFGGATSNPGLEPERAITMEVGAADTVFGNTRLEGALFHSRVTDVIQSVGIIYNGSSVTQNQNVGNGQYFGFELSATTAVTSTLTVGGNYSYIRRDIDTPSNPIVKPIGTPINKLFAYATYKPLESLSITPSIETASDRWTSNTAATAYYTTGAYTLVNLQADWKITPNLEAAIGVRNLLDDNYQLTDGFPEAGRTFFLNARATF